MFEEMRVTQKDLLLRQMYRLNRIKVEHIQHHDDANRSDSITKLIFFTKMNNEKINFFRES